MDVATSESTEPMTMQEAATTTRFSSRVNLRSRRASWAIAWLSALLILAVATWIWWTRRDDVLRLPAAERRALYERTLGTLATFCDPQPRPGISDYCQQQAALALQFPECDAACRTLADRYRSRPSR
jgi:hypothetical protein